VLSLTLQTALLTSRGSNNTSDFETDAMIPVKEFPVDPY